jgi:hypothetical protein
MTPASLLTPQRGEHVVQNDTAGTGTDALLTPLQNHHDTGAAAAGMPL